MISLSFSIRSPWKIGFDISKLDCCKYRSISKNKTFEFQTFSRKGNELFDLDVTTEWEGSDHAGPHFNIIILGFYLGVQVYDNRHWKHEENRWYRDDEDPFEGAGDYEPEN